MAKINVGDTVRMTGKFLRNTGQQVGGEGKKRWTVKDIQGSFAVVDEDADTSYFTAEEMQKDPSLRWRRINVGNLEPVKGYSAAKHEAGGNPKVSGMRIVETKSGALSGGIWHTVEARAGKKTYTIKVYEEARGLRPHATEVRSPSGRELPRGTKFRGELALEAQKLVRAREGYTGLSESEERRETDAFAYRDVDVGDGFVVKYHRGSERWIIYHNGRSTGEGASFHGASGFEKLSAAIERAKKIKADTAEMKKHEGGGNPGVSKKSLTKLDLLLDQVEAGKRELTIDADKYTTEQKDRIVAAAKSRGLHISGTDRWLLIRDLRSVGSHHESGRNPLTLSESLRIRTRTLSPAAAREAFRREKRLMEGFIAEVRRLSEAVSACQRCDAGAERHARVALKHARKSLVAAERLAAYRHDKETSESLIKTLEAKIEEAEKVLGEKETERGRENSERAAAARGGKHEAGGNPRVRKPPKPKFKLGDHVVTDTGVRGKIGWIHPYDEYQETYKYKLNDYDEYASRMPLTYNESGLRRVKKPSASEHEAGGNPDIQGNPAGKQIAYLYGKHDSNRYVFVTREPDKLYYVWVRDSLEGRPAWTYAFKSKSKALRQMRTTAGHGRTSAAEKNYLIVLHDLAEPHNLRKFKLHSAHSTLAKAEARMNKFSRSLGQRAAIIERARAHELGLNPIVSVKLSAADLLKMTGKKHRRAAPKPKRKKRRTGHSSVAEVSLKHRMQKMMGSRGGF